MARIDDHRLHVSILRTAATGTSGVSEASLRAAVLARAGEGGRVEEPYDQLATAIGASAGRVTDAQVASVRAATGSDKAAFEMIMVASLGAGLVRWDAAIRVIDEASDASA